MAFKERIPKGFLSVRSYAKKMSVSTRTIMRMIENKEIAVKRGRWRWFIKVEEGKHEL